MVLTKKGANLGMKALYGVVAILFLSILMFFMGTTEYEQTSSGLNWASHISNPDSFFMVFAIVFPAFTGITAGVGLSGDLKDPKRSIPVGTLAATMAGMIIYGLIGYKLALAASPEDLDSDQLIMMNVAIWAPIIPIGLACATLSSALGSILVAPRVLQAMAADHIFPGKWINAWLAKGREVSNDPFNATIVTSAIALFFVAIGDIDAVAQIISMFFMITYGSLCLISFLQHFAADPAYRPSFKSKWYISLLGAVSCIYLMFKMDTVYAAVSILLMMLIYILVTRASRTTEGLSKIFQGVVYQLSRKLQVFIQNAERHEENWRPTVICISSDFFVRPMAFNFLRWMSHRYGFGTYIHFINGYFSKDTYKKSEDELARLIKISGENRSNVYLDTMITPSFTNAIAQAIQLPSVSGNDINMILLEYSKKDPSNLNQIIDNFTLARAAQLDFCILGTSERDFGFMNNVHIWITPNDIQNANLMIMLAYVIMGHSDWKNAQVKIFSVFPEEEMEEQKANLIELIKAGRLPISPNNVNLLAQRHEVHVKDIINERSKDADLTIVGFRSEALKQLGNKLFQGYDAVGNVLFVNAVKKKEIS